MMKEEYKELVERAFSAMAHAYAPVSYTHLKELTKDATEVKSNDDMAAKVGQSMNGIGYTSLSTDFEKNNVKALQYEGVDASSETVLDGTYKLQRPFMYVTRAKGDFGNDDKQQLVEAFLDFISNSQEGMEVVKAACGEVDITKAKLWEEIAKKYPVSVSYTHLMHTLLLMYRNKI